MEAIETLKRTIHVTRELQSLVKTMKVLAGLNIRQYERAAQAVAQYNRTVEMGLQIVLRNVPEPALPPHPAPGRKLGALVFGSDQGMCGTLNDAIVAHASRALARLARRHQDQALIAVGVRAAGQLENAGQPPETTLGVPDSVSGITTTVHELLARIEEWRVRGIEIVVLFNCRLVTGVFYRPRGLRLLPVDADWIRGLQARRWPTRVLPTYFHDTEHLLHSLVHEYLFVSLFRALAESLASENAARLASMQVAERNIEDRLKALTSEFHQSRQSAITSELLDIISGFEALKGKAHG
ncbi:MAG: F0F1 ATP synthase subunit gamma [Acidobacteriales bacterium]|nr:F0F1 ATP synthase subunit gamma [Terriglobales bacterium]